MSTFSGSSDLFRSLMAQRDALELEAFALSEDLQSPGPNGEPPAGIKDPLVDREGFPRNDIDLFAVCEKRQRLAVINTDHKALMRQIEREMKNVYTTIEVLPSPPSQQQQEQVSNIHIQAKDVHYTAFAIINEILDGSPAKESGLIDGDKLISFGTVSAKAGSDAINMLPEIVRSNMNKPISLKISRSSNGGLIDISITPKVWGGRGVIGCHFSPIR